MSAMATPTPTTYLSSLPSIPLTTTFTTPTQCAGLYANTAGIAVYDPFTSCYPPNFTLGTTNYFSPGLYCPIRLPQRRQRHTRRLVHDNRNLLSSPRLHLPLHRNQVPGYLLGYLLLYLDPRAVGGDYAAYYRVEE